MNNAAVLDYLQEARVAYLLDSPMSHLLGHGIIVVSHQVEYLAAIGFSAAPLEVTMQVGDVSAARFTMAYDVLQGGRVVVRARTVICLFDFEAGRPRSLAPDERAWFAAQAEPLEPLRDVGDHRVGAMAHTQPLVVRWSDIDRYAHVNNTLYYDYLGEARVALYAELLPDAVKATADVDPAHRWLVARQDLVHRGQMTYRREPYAVRTAVGPLGRTSAVLAAEIVDPATTQPMARALTVVVHADATGAPAPLPDELRAAGRRWPAVCRREAVR